MTSVLRKEPTESLKVHLADMKSLRPLHHMQNAFHMADKLRRNKLVKFLKNVCTFKDITLPT